MNRDKQEVQNIFHQIGQTAQQEGDRVDSAFSASAKNIGKAFAAIGIAATMKEFGTQIMKVRGEFQKLEVAFEVMLGSAKEADSLMKQQRLLSTCRESQTERSSYSHTEQQRTKSTTCLCVSATSLLDCQFRLTILSCSTELR